MNDYKARYRERINVKIQEHKEIVEFLEKLASKYNLHRCFEQAEDLYWTFPECKKCYVLCYRPIENKIRIINQLIWKAEDLETYLPLEISIEDLEDKFKNKIYVAYLKQIAWKKKEKQDTKLKLVDKLFV